MRIFISPTATDPWVPQEPPEPPPPDIYIETRIPAISRWEFSGGSGEVFPVYYALNRDGTGAVVLEGTEGLSDPPVDIPDLEVPTWDGGAVTDPIYKPREIFFRMHVSDKTHEESQARIQKLRNITNNRRYGLTTLSCVTSGNQVRWIQGQRVVSGADTDWTPQYHDKDWRSLAVTLKCADPWWKGDLLSYSWVNTAGNEWFPILPVILSPLTVIGDDLPVFMPGDAPAYPVWEITGPLTEIKVVHADTAAEWRLAITLTAGQKVTVDTDPRNLRVLGPTGSSVWANLIPPYYDMFPLLPGNNTIQVTLTGSTAASSIKMNVRPRYASAV